MGRSETTDQSARTSAVYFANGTVVDVAKLEGSQDYKSVMRRLTAPAADTQTMNTFSDETTAAGYHTRLLHDLHRRFRLPCIPGSRWFCQKPEVQALDPMIQALKVATVSYVGGPADTLLVTFPVEASDLAKSTVMSALKQNGLDTSGLLMTAGPSAAAANDIGWHHSEDDPPQFVLTLDYSRAALTAVLWLEEGGAFLPRQEIHRVELGVDALEDCKRNGGSSACYAGLTQAILEITEHVGQPKPDDDPDVPHHLEQLVLLGESAGDPHLRHALQEVFSRHGTPRHLKSLNIEDSDMAEPAFAAARGTAMGALRWNDPLFGYFTGSPDILCGNMFFDLN